MNFTFTWFDFSIFKNNFGEFEILKFNFIVSCEF